VQLRLAALPGGKGTGEQGADEFGAGSKLANRRTGYPEVARAAMAGAKTEDSPPLRQ
jgi:hypothetical protein